MSYLTDYQRTHPKTVANLPDEEHYAIFVNQTFNYDDGYGERGQPSISKHESLDYIVCKTETELQEWILKNRDKQFRIAIVKPIKFKEHVSFEFSQ